MVPAAPLQRHQLHRLASEQAGHSSEGQRRRTACRTRCGTARRCTGRSALESRILPGCGRILPGREGESEPPNRAAARQPPARPARLYSRRDCPLACRRRHSARVRSRCVRPRAARPAGCGPWRSSAPGRGRPGGRPRGRRGPRGRPVLPGPRTVANRNRRDPRPGDLRHRHAGPPRAGTRQHQRHARRTGRIDRQRGPLRAARSRPPASGRSRRPRRATSPSGSASAGRSKPSRRSSSPTASGWTAPTSPSSAAG